RAIRTRASPGAARRARRRDGCRSDRAQRPRAWVFRKVTMDHLKTRIRNVPDFPRAGILFYDITTLLQDPEGFRLAIDAVTLPFRDQQIELVVGIESRGFIFGAAVADRIGAGFAPVRKPGKLPSST